MKLRRHRIPAAPPLSTPVVMAVLVVVALIAGCSGGDDAESGLGPEAPGVTVAPSTTAPGGSSTTVVVAGQEPTDETATTVTTPPTGPTTTTTTAVPTAETTTTTAPGGGATTTSTTVTPTTVDPDGPVLRLGADDYQFTIAECVYYDGVDVAIVGPGETSDGTPVYLSMQIDTLRIDIGTDQPFQEMDDHWLAGVGANDDLVVTINDFEVTITGTFVRSPGRVNVHSELVVDCPLG